MTISTYQLVSKFKTLEHFRQAFIDHGKVMIKLRFLSWKYVKDIMSGQKKLVTQDQLKNYVPLPR